MATLGVVNFSSVQPHNKIQILQQSSTNNSNNSTSREVIVIHRKPSILVKPPPPTPVNNNTTNKNNNTRVITSKKKQAALVSKAVIENGGSMRSQSTPPVAVARRNARERNRVKQVNNGFATLRQHIPDSLANIYASSENHTGRGNSKKLSKVETLRMAVDYIRRLQMLLSIEDDDIPNMSMRSPLSTTGTTSPTSSHNPSMNQNYSMSYEDDTEHEASSVIMEDEDSSEINTTPASPSVPIQYHVTPEEQKSYTYQYEVDENMAPLLNASMSSLGRIALVPSARVPNNDYSHDIYQGTTSPLQNMMPMRHPSASLSPGVYSEQSLSPMESHSSPKLHYLPPFSSALKSPINASMVAGDTVIHQTYHTMQQLVVKKEEIIDDEVTGHHGGENMIDMINWLGA